MAFENYIKRTFMFLIMLVFIAEASFAQGSGTLRGTVTDKTTGESLPGANVVIKGTSIGVATDLDGKFVLRNVPAGSRVIVASYIGYESDSATIRFANDASVTHNFELNITALEGEEVIVTAQAQGQLEAINQQLSSNKIENVVSEARIQELPDFNAAQAISRLPGVSTLQNAGEANKVVIRGLAPQYNAVEVEGLKLASTGSTNIGATSLENSNAAGNGNGTISSDRSVDLSMVTPYMIKQISVYKALTPDFNANAIGGVVNMELREAPAGWHGDVLWQSGFTEKSGRYGNYRGVLSVSNRFLNDNLGVYLLGNVESFDRYADNMSANYDVVSSTIGANGYEDVFVRNVQLSRRFETRQRFGANLILDYALPNGSIKAINMYSGLKSNFEDNRILLNYTGAGSGNINFRYEEGENTINLGVNSLEFDYDFDFISMNLKGAYTYSENSLPESPRLDLNQTGGIQTSRVEENTTPETLPRFVTFFGDTNSYLRTINLFSTNYKEDNLSFKGDFIAPIEFNNSLITGFIKFGGEYKDSEHKNDQETPYVALNTGGGNRNLQMMNEISALYGINYASNGLFQASEFTAVNDELYEPFLDDDFGQFYYGIDATIPRQIINFLKNDPRYEGQAGSDPGGWYDGPYQRLTNDYTYKEQYYAGYAMSELNFMDLMIVGGVRYEKVKSDYFAYNAKDARSPRTQIMYEVNANPENEFWLPMVQIKYNAFEWLDVRYAYTQTLARPDYHQLSPKYTINNSGNAVYSGNPTLKPARAFNHDLIFSFHNNEIGLLTIGGFYKTIKEFTYSFSYDINKYTKAAGIDSLERWTTPPFPNMDADANVNLSTFINSPFDATVKGIEFDFQTNFWYLPQPFNGLVLGINYTKIESETQYPFRNQTTYVIPPRGVGVWVVDSARAGRLIYQPNDILNSYIGYDYEGFSVRFSFVFQGNSVSSIGRYPVQDGLTEDYFRVDASARQKLPWEGSEVFLDIYNLNDENNVSAQRSINGFTSVQNYGFSVNLGVRFRY